MSSIIPGYEYDIFISYRQKDNRYDQWVTDFVDNLSKELESTFKENVTIYFDQNPHDGLHETDDVGRSLAPKLKSIIFIPIVSHTYCDPQAFAWRHELLPFIQQASKDHIGLNVRNSRGNISSRILSVRIHDLDPEDQTLFERETGTPFRPVDLVYRATGVNRPLRARDDELRENLNHNNYRDQINRVASVVKEVINAVRRDRNEPITVVQPLRTESASSDRKKINPILFTAVAVLLLIAAFATYFISATSSSPKTSASSSTEDAPKATRSIAVLPFADMSATHDQEYFGDGISEELLNTLSKVSGLTVISRTSAFAFKGKNEDVRDIGRKLNVAYLLEGSVRKAGNVVRITTQLIKTNDGSHVWSETYQNDFKDIFAIQDEIAKAVTNQLRLKLSLSPSKPRESNPEVYNLLLQAKFYKRLGTVESTDKAFDLLQRANGIDSTDARIIALMSSVETFRSENTYNGQEVEEHARKSEALAYKAIRLDPNLVDGYLNAALAEDYRLNFDEEKKLLDKAMALEPNSYVVIINMAWWYQIQGQFEAAKTMFEKCVALDPMMSYAYNSLAKNCLARRQYNEALKYSRKAIALHPIPSNYIMHGIVYLLNGKPDSALICALKPEDEFWKLYLENMALWSQGKKKAAEAKLKLMIDKYQDIGAFQIAEIYGWEGNTEKSLQWLQLAAERNDGGLIELKLSPFLNYHNDPRYIEILRKVKLPVDP